MKKAFFPVLLALLLIFAMIPASVMAATAPSAADLKTPPVISNLEIHDDGSGFVWLEVTVKTPANVLNAIDYYENHELGYNQAGYIGGIELQYSIDGKEAEVSGLGFSPNYDQGADGTWNGIFETEYLDELHVDSAVKASARYTGADANGDIRYSDWSNELTLNEKVDFNASQWAQDELAEADRLGLIPDSLKNADLTKPITRAEFAAVSVRAYEALSGEKAQPVASNPFTDTSDAEVLKAFNVGVTNGVSATKFEPNTLLNREQAATMLTRVYKKVALDGWTLADDASFTLDYQKGAAFADDAMISGWAKDSVYFMASKGIINGVGDNKFAPKATTEAEKAIGYAQATREQAIAIATRMVKNL